MQPQTNRLYRYDQPRNQWELEAASVSPHFYDANEDSGKAKPIWCLEIGEAETTVTDQFRFEETALRVVFEADEAAGKGIWALRFANAAAYRNFHNEYNDKLFQNIFGVANDEVNRQKVRKTGLEPNFSQKVQKLTKAMVVQVFGKDSVLNVGRPETQESRDGVGCRHGGGCKLL